jgi:ribonuclease-3
MPSDLVNLQDKIEFHFSNLSILDRALTHRSFNQEHNERLEFLGDSILGLVVSEALWRDNPEATEGELSRMRANLVNRDTLADIAQGGLEQSRKLVKDLLGSRLSRRITGANEKDSKTRLQELLQSSGLALPQYQVIDTSGEAHDQTFTVTCLCALIDKPVIGEGKSKRLAEQNAASQVLENLANP